MVWWRWHYIFLGLIFPVKQWDHSSNGEVLLHSNMFYSEMTSCYWQTLLPSSMKVMWSRNRAECRESVFVKNRILSSNPLNCSFLVCASGDFLQTSVNQKPYCPYCIHPPTHTHAHTQTHTHTHTYTHTHSYKLGSTWIDTMWTDIPSCPSETLRCAALKVLKLLSASSPPVSVYPFIFPSFNPPIPHLSLCFSKILISHFLRFYYF